MFLRLPIEIVWLASTKFNKSNHAHTEPGVDTDPIENLHQDEFCPDTGGKRDGLTLPVTSVFIVGEMSGSGVLALPGAVVNAGYFGLPLIVFCCCAAGYNGINLGRCWNMVQERYPECRTGHMTRPYTTIGEKAVGKWMSHIVSVTVNITLFGAATVFLLLASQNVQDMLVEANVHTSFCYWLIIMAAVLTPVTWLGTPKDFWPIAVGASVTTAIACVLLLINILMDIPYHEPTHSNTDPKSFFLAFGAILFSFGGASAFPTIQHDMREPRKFHRALLWAFAAILLMYIPVAASGYFVYGDDVKNNVLQSASHGALRIIVQILITGHLVFAFNIVLNPVAQELGGVFKIPTYFHWKRCLLRTGIVLTVLFVSESIPHFGAILDLIGGSTITFLTFVAPSLFYIRLCGMEGEWPNRSLPLGVKLVNVVIMSVGVIGGIAATVSAVHQIAGPSTFIPPCYVNITAASAG